MPDAVVNFGEVLFDDSQTFYKSSDDGIYVDYAINSRYVKDRHTYCAGITSPNGFKGKSVAMFQLASPTLPWVVEWTASKAGEEPDIPNPDQGNTNWVLLDDDFTPTMLVTGPDGNTPLYRISGRYVYAHVSPPDQTINAVSFPKPPWMQDGLLRVIPASRLKKGIINPGISQGGDDFLAHQSSVAPPSPPG